MKKRLEELLKMEHELKGGNREWLLYSKPKVLSKEELVKFQLDWLTKDLFHLSDTQLMVMSYIFIYNNSYLDKLLKDKVLGSKKTIENYVSELRKLDLVSGKLLDLQLHKELKPIINNISFTLKFNIE